MTRALQQSLKDKIQQIVKEAGMPENIADVIAAINQYVVHHFK